MFFKKSNIISENQVFLKGNGELIIPNGSDIEKQIQMIGLTVEDLQIINGLQPYVQENIGVIVDRFYENLENEPLLLKIITDNSTIQRLKMTLTQHITEMFEGVIDESYFQKRFRIAHMHVRIGLQTKWYMCAFQDLLLSIMNIVEEKAAGKTAYFSIIRAVSKILNLEQQLVLEAYDAQNDRLKKQVEEQKALIRVNVASASQNLAAISEQTNASFQQLQSQSEEIVTIANIGTELSALAEERAQKGKEQLLKQNTHMSNIQISVTDISNDVQVLLQISKQMQEIINIVTGIADQTNLLSLNAAIEAARAGEHGRGFSVVADEVRKLSEETKKSVINVSSLISNTNAQAEKLTDSLSKISGAVKEGNRSMKETETYFHEIHTTMGQTKQQNNQIEKELLSFVNVVTELGDAFEQVALSADELTMITSEME
ncbi:globin-coupled sensor protein [Bacillus sp. ISL-47]|uniref:globin-coupled sensor protein n=1 Tax=Bacillus sp. ISL-47 TaxID=2819130 RepID=UPI001BEB171A|nr:globin-coupled sensor protein [Bacillus sp. ISL-47]MBT2688803.1 globin-coupled sensor protein [Bacillus sp. ISL-47]MBT2710308.1 hypothetical protein [Pseudomonas sp. ISL-84]